MPRLWRQMLGCLKCERAATMHAATCHMMRRGAAVGTAKKCLWFQGTCVACRDSTPLFRWGSREGSSGWFQPAHYLCLYMCIHVCDWYGSIVLCISIFFFCHLVNVLLYLSKCELLRNHHVAVRILPGSCVYLCRVWTGPPPAKVLTVLGIAYMVSCYVLFCALVVKVIKWWINLIWFELNLTDLYFASGKSIWYYLS